MADHYSRRSDAPGYALIHMCGSALYCLGSAWTISAFMGLFLRYLDRPSRTWRYLADTALWVYLIHQPLVIIGLAMFRPLHLTWWAQTATVSIIDVAAALLLYEAIVRPTPLVRLFGPASPRRPAGASRPGAAPSIA
jgi:glucans biosynthesis protein C